MSFRLSEIKYDDLFFWLSLIWSFCFVIVETLPHFIMISLIPFRIVLDGFLTTIHHDLLIIPWKDASACNCHRMYSLRKTGSGQIHLHGHLLSDNADFVRLLFCKSQHNLCCTCSTGVYDTCNVVYVFVLVTRVAQSLFHNLCCTCCI